MIITYYQTLDMICDRNFAEMEPTKLIDALDFLASYIMNLESNFEEEYENVDANSNWEENV